MTERRIEHKVCDWAQKNGWYQRKFSSPNHRGVPDRVFVKHGRVVFVEFKTVKGRATPLQLREIRLLRAHGVEAYVCRTVEQGIEILSNDPREQMTDEQWLSDEWLQGTDVMKMIETKRGEEWDWLE